MKVCFWGDVSGALTGKTSGGSELQIALLAKGLVRAGHEVVCVDYESATDFVTPDGVKVERVQGWNNGVRMIRLFTHRLPNLYRNLKGQKADIYYCRMRDYTHILAYWAARKNRSKFILAMASDLDALDFKMRWEYYYVPNKGGIWWFFSGLMNEIIHPWLLKKADSVFVQHEGQKEILKKKGINSVLFNNLIDISKIPAPTKSEHSEFVYVGWLDKRKGFQEFFDLVNKSPLQRFRVVGPPRDKTGTLYYSKLKSYENVILMGQLDHNQTLLNISNSKALISTSPMEGFPNIFIEAWALGIPVFSLYFDPGGVIKKEGLGEVGDGDIGKLAEALTVGRDLDEFAEKAKLYVETHHVLNSKKIDEINELFNDILNSHSANISK
jgi:glycosyltransferase involved in cell wall biosynthesis